MRKVFPFNLQNVHTSEMLACYLILEQAVELQVFHSWSRQAAAAFRMSPPHVIQSSHLNMLHYKSLLRNNTLLQII